jgi:hypothetical protein
VAAGDVLGEVFGQVADAAAGVLGPGEHALGVELGPEPGHMQRIIVRADPVQRLVPGRQDLARRGIKAGRRQRPASARKTRPARANPIAQLPLISLAYPARRPVLHGAVFPGAELSRSRLSRLGRSLQSRRMRSASPTPDPAATH